MKRITIYVCLLIMSFICCGCSNNVISSDLEHSPESECYLSSAESFDTLDELAAYIIESNNKNLKSIVEDASTNVQKSKFSMYKLANIPNDYDLHDVTLHGNFISMNYLNDDAEKYELTQKEIMSKNSKKISRNSLDVYKMESSSLPDESSENSLTKTINNMSKITFVWGYNTEGDEYLKNAIKTFELKKMPNNMDCYYSEAEDDYGVHIYQIYWSKDGYCFQLNIPTAMFDNVKKYSYNGNKSINKSELIDVEKIEYDATNISKQLASK